MGDLSSILNSNVTTLIAVIGSAYWLGKKIDEKCK